MTGAQRFYDYDPINPHHTPPVTPPAPPASTPLTIAGASLTRWCEMGLSEVVSGGFVTTWADLSGNGYDGTAVGTQQPFYEAGGWNGQPSMAFDGGNDFFTIVAAYAAKFSGSAPSYTLWLALQFFEVTDNVPFSCGNSGASTPFLDFFASTTANAYRFSKNDGMTPRNIDSPGHVDLLRHVFKIKVYANNTVDLWIDGVPVVTGVNFASASVTFNKATEGCLGRNTSAFFFFGREAAHVCVNTILGASAENDMDVYFQKFLRTPTAPMIVINGDSRSTADKWPVNFALAYPNATIVNTAVAGQTLFGYGVPNVIRDTTSIFGPSRSANLLSTMFGANDIVNARTGLQIYNNTATIVSDQRAANPTGKIMVATIYWRLGLSTSEENERQDFNTRLRADKAGADYLFDADLILTSADYPTLMPDGTHPNALGCTYLFEGRNGVNGIRYYSNLAGF